MLCSNCSKLAILNTIKSCIRCRGEVHQNISIICEICSLSEKVCAACFKKVFIGFSSPVYKNMYGGCRACGK